MSHPTWVRGLKLSLISCNQRINMSHPTWVRGLKLDYEDRGIKDQIVAPYMGAWIETILLY